MKPFIFVALVALSVGFIVSLTLNPRRQHPVIVAGNNGQPPDSSALSFIPVSIADIVEESEAVVIARSDGLDDLGEFVFSTPEPTPIGVATGEPPEPTYAWNQAGMNVVIDQIIKNDGTLSVNDTIQLVSAGSVPANPTEEYEDSISQFPMFWPDDTEFVIFLRRNPETNERFVYFGEYGRVLTDSEQVTLSDGSRTVPDYMTGMDREDFIHAVETAVADYTKTPTPTNTPVPTNTPTPTPCSGPGC